MTDIFISTPDEAALFDREPRRFDGRSLHAKGVLSLMLSTLHAIALDEEWSEEHLDRDFHVLLERDEGERLIWELPSSLVATLSTANDQKRSELLSAWCATDELNCDPRGMAEYFDALVCLAKRATAEKRRLYLWECC